MYREALIAFLLFLLSVPVAQGQYRFSGVVDSTLYDGQVYLSLVEDYRKARGVYPEQVLARRGIDSMGEFLFEGENLPATNRIYRIHIDTCSESDEDRNHLAGECLNSRSMLFIANNSDTVDLPFSFDSQMFCRIDSSNEKAGLLLQIDSLEQLMTFEFATYRSQANRKLNGERWMAKLKEFGQDTGEPLAELYLYSLVSDRNAPLYPFYREDVNSPYFEELGSRIEAAYGQSVYLEQYDRELAADRYLAEPPLQRTLWPLLLGLLLLISIGMNMRLSRKVKKLKAATVPKPSTLSEQEQRVLELILANRSNKQIAAELFISLSTVKTHINNLYKKLGVNSREDLKSRYA